MGILYGLMGLVTDETQAMPPPTGDTGRTARSRRGSAAETDDDDELTVSEGAPPTEKSSTKGSPASTAGSVDPNMAAEIQRQIQMALKTQADLFRNEADEQRRQHNRQLEDMINSMEATKAAEVMEAVKEAKDAFTALAEDQATRAEELENEILSEVGLN